MFECENNDSSEEICNKNDIVSEWCNQSLTESETIEVRVERRLQSMKTTTNWLLSQTKCRPKVAVICGSGLGSFADCIQDVDSFEYSAIPHFVPCTVPGHVGRLVFGSVAGVDVVAMQGRIHSYEHHSMWQLTFPVRVVASLGVDVLISTSACGSLNPAYNVGDFVIVKDHINLPGLVGLNPLKGLCDDRFGPRFPCMTDAYDRQLRLAAWRVGRQLGFADFMREGISLILCGPNFETQAELRMIRALGADVVGMSSAPEVTVARQCSMRCFSLALVTDVAEMHDDDTSQEETRLEKNSSDVIEGARAGVSHEAVLNAASRQAKNIELFFCGLIREIGTMLKSKTE